MRNRLHAVRRAVTLEAFEPRRLLSAVLDSSFGNAGVVNYSDGAANSYSNAISVVAPGGKIVSLAELDSADNVLSVHRFTSTGAPDATFGVGGAELVDLGTGDNTVKPTDLAVAADGSIYIAGEYNDPNAGFTDVGFVAHLLPGGALDTSYGGGSSVPGLALLNPTGQQVNEPHLALGTATLYVGYTLIDDATNSYSAAVTELIGGGTVEPSYGTAGTSVTPIAGKLGDLRDLYLHGSTLTLVGDTFATDNSGSFTDKSVFFANLDFAGHVDTSVGIGGFKLTHAIDDTFDVYGTAVSPSGYVVGGNAFTTLPDNSIQAYPVFMSFNASGDLVTGFGSGGTLVVPASKGVFLSTEAYDGAIAVDSQGNIYGTGYATVDAAAFTYDIAVLRVTAAGALDSTFDGDGIYTFDQAAVDIGTAITVNASDSAIATGINSNPAATLLQFVPATPPVAPNHAPVVATVTGPTAAVHTGQAVTFSATFSDVDVGDALSGSWNFGDGVITAFTALSGNATSISHSYAATGSYTVTFTVRDSHAATGSKSTGVTVVPTTPYVYSGGQLTLTGSSAADTVELTRNASGQAVLNYNGTTYVIGAASGVNSIVINGGAGNDLISVAADFTAPATLIGGDGNDTLRGGSGNDVLSGDAGNDSLNGFNGRDLIIGGLGADDINGSAQDDILVSGTTTQSTNFAALTAIQAEWTSNKPFLVRVANVSGLVPLPNRLNGNNYLTPNVTVFSDSSIDTITGGDGDDFYFIDLFGSDADVIRGNVSLSESIVALLMAL